MSDAAFLPEALAENQSGRLSDAQRDHLKAFMKHRYGGLGGFVGRAVDPIAWDVRIGRVASVDGAIRKNMLPTLMDAAASPRWELRLTKLDGGRANYWTSAPLYEYALDFSMVRLFYLPTSRWVINLEQLPDPPAGAEGKAADIAQAGAHARDIESYIADPAAAASQPAATADAIVGRWTSPFGTLDFGAGGTLDAKLGDGSAYQGRWSLDADGRLHADMMGSPMVAEATIAGDELTLVMDGQALALRRA